MTGYILTKADADLGEIWEYITADSVDVADAWIAKLFDVFEALSKTPQWATFART